MDRQLYLDLGAKLTAILFIYIQGYKEKCLQIDMLGYELPSCTERQSIEIYFKYKRKEVFNIKPVDEDKWPTYVLDATIYGY